MLQSLLVRGDRSRHNYVQWTVQGDQFRGGGGGDHRKRDRTSIALLIIQKQLHDSCISIDAFTIVFEMFSNYLM